MENLCDCNREQDSDSSCGTVLLKEKRDNDSEIAGALLIKKLILALEDENTDLVDSLIVEFLNSSSIFVKSWSSGSHPENQERKFNIWRDAMYIAMERNTKYSEEILNIFFDCDIIWSLETKMDDVLLRRLIRYEKNVEDKKTRLIDMLLKYGQINVNAIDKTGSTALHWAEEEKLISLLIHYGAQVNKKDEEGKAPLLHMWSKQPSFLQTILNEARALVDLDAIDCNGQTALMIATIHDQPDVVELLLNAGASVNLSDHLGFTALHHALYASFDHCDHFPQKFEELKKRKEIFAILFDEKNEEELKKWKEKKMKTVEMLLRRPDIDVNVLSFDKFSPLDLAEIRIPETPSSIKNALKQKGAILNVFQQTAIQSTSDFHLDVRCRLALQRHLVYVCRNDEASLPVDLAENRLMSLIDTFQDQIVAGKDQQGRTALHLVAIFFSIIWAEYYWRSKNDVEDSYLGELKNRGATIVKELIRIGCNVNETDVFGRTPLHYADKILKDLLISNGADASIKDKDGKSAIDEIALRSSTKLFDIVKAVIDRVDETFVLRLMNSKQMEIKVQCVDSQIRTYDGRKCCVNTVPRFLWEEGEYAFRHPLVKQITKEVTDLMDAIAEEIEKLDPRFAIKPEFVGSSNEETKIDQPDEFDFCFVLTKISELCEVSQSPELPTGFIRLKRKSLKVEETGDCDSFFEKDGILNTEKLKGQFATILLNAMVNIESQQSFDCNLKLPIRGFFDAIKKVSNVVMIKSLNPTSVKYISIDIVPCIHVDGWWPDEAIFNVSDKIKKSGCNLIFDRPQKQYQWVPYSECCARISFAKAESDTIKQSCDNAREAYMIGKTMVECSKWHCGYIVKNCLLHCIEALTPTSKKASQLGLSLEELESKFHQMDRYMWLKCLMKCHLEFVSQDFCPCYFLPSFNLPIASYHLKAYCLNWMTRDDGSFRRVCKIAHALHRCTSSAISESCWQLPAPDPLWERFDRNQLIASLCEIAYSTNNLKL